MHRPQTLQCPATSCGCSTRCVPQVAAEQHTQPACVCGSRIDWPNLAVSAAAGLPTFISLSHPRQLLKQMIRLSERKYRKGNKRVFVNRQRVPTVETHVKNLVLISYSSRSLASCWRMSKGKKVEPDLVSVCACLRVGEDAPR